MVGDAVKVAIDHCVIDANLSDSRPCPELRCAAQAPMAHGNRDRTRPELGHEQICCRRCELGEWAGDE
jgi:hypothetical protein